MKNASFVWIDRLILPAINLIAAFVLSALIVLSIGENPLHAMGIILWGALGWAEGIGYTLFYTTNFIFTGLCVAVAFHAGLFNIGGEGQAYIGGLGVAFVCLALDRITPWWLTLPFVIVMAAAFGALWAAIPGWLQAYRGSHVVITTIMFNFLASALMIYLLVNVIIADSSTMQPETRTFEAGGRVPLISDIFPLLDFGAAPLNLTLILALIAALLIWVLIWRTRLGYEIRTFGANPRAAICAGISPTRITIIAMALSGGLAGLMAINEIMGSQHRLVIEFVSGYGFVGIAVALMGRAHPVGIVLAALLFGVLYQGGAELSFEIPGISRDMIVVIQGLVILFAGALEHVFRPVLLPIVRRFTASARRLRGEAR